MYFKIAILRPHQLNNKPTTWDRICVRMHITIIPLQRVSRLSSSHHQTELNIPIRISHSAHTSTQDILNIYAKRFNFNFNYQHTTQCLDCGEYIYKQLHFGRMHISLFYLLCNSAPWSSTTEICTCYRLRKYISFVNFSVFITN